MESFDFFVVYHEEGFEDYTIAGFKFIEDASIFVESEQSILEDGREPETCYYYIVNVAGERQREAQEYPMSDLVDVEILQDPTTNRLLADHGIQDCAICHEFPVFCVIVCHDEDWAIPVCGTCFRNAPLVGQVVS